MVADVNAKSETRHTNIIWNLIAELFEIEWDHSYNLRTAVEPPVIYSVNVLD